MILSLSLAACAQLPPVLAGLSLREPASVGLTAAESVVPSVVTPRDQADVEAPWWQALGSEELNRLIEQALLEQPRLDLAQARLARARSGLAQARASQSPQLVAGTDLTYQHYTANGAVPPPLAGGERASGSLQLSGSWELDFFGRHHAAIESALGQAQAAQADVAAARQLLASQIARMFIELSRLQAQQALADRALRQRADMLALVQDRVSAGLDTRLELLQSEGALPEARLALSQLQEREALVRNALAALVGRPHMAQSLKAVDLGQMQRLSPRGGLDLDLLGRRADIVAARWRVQAATQDVVDARTQFYPNINLVGFAGLSSIGLDRLLTGASQQWGVGPAVRLPVFEGGRLSAQLKGRLADQDAAVAAYNQTLVQAVREVADELASQQAVVGQQADQAQALASAEAAYDTAVLRYKAGLVNHLSVLTAEARVLAQRRAHTDLLARELDVSVGLMHSLGGTYGPALVSPGL